MATDSKLTELRDLWLEQIHKHLPDVAEERDWPVTTADGIKRVILDTLLGGPWDRVVDDPDKRPYTQLTASELEDAVHISHMIETAPACMIESLDDRSAAYRGELTGPADEIPPGEDPTLLTNVEHALVQVDGQTVFDYYRKDGEMRVIANRQTNGDPGRKG